MHELRWREDFRVGHPVLDEQHRRIIDLCTALRRARLDSAADDLAMLVVVELGEYIHYHFEEEERLMVSVGFPDLDAHIGKHREFAGTVERMVAELQDGLIRVEDVYHVLVDWVESHILQADREYIPYLCTKRAG